MDNPTQVGRAFAQPGIELIPACSPGAKGHSERMFGSLQRRLSQGTQTRRRHRYGDRQPVPRGALPASGCRPKPGAALSCPSPGRWRLSSASRRSAPPPTTTHALQGADPADLPRHHCVKARVRVRDCPDGTMTVSHGTRCLAPDTPRTASSSKQHPGRPGNLNRSGQFRMLPIPNFAQYSTQYWWHRLGPTGPCRAGHARELRGQAAHQFESGTTVDSKVGLHQALRRTSREVHAVGDCVAPRQTPCCFLRGSEECSETPARHCE